MMTCENVRKKLSEDLLLQEDEHLCMRVREHMMECSECREFRESLGHTIGCFKAYESAPPPDLHALVIQRLRDEGLTKE